ncbi:MAG: PepSY-like domain-containing protein [Tannerella sp.]|jgi:hypothetical protein|nr:PepSY-like domain-containing protein [Tannerella sp.]
MKKVILLLNFTVLFCMFFACSDDDKVINESELPSSAKTFLETYFSGQSVLDTRKDNDEYKIYYTNYKVEFDRQGIWKQVEGKQIKNDYKAVPYAFLNEEIPAGIVVWITQYYLNTSIVEVEKEYEKGVHIGYDIELNNGIDDLDFDLNGNYTKGTTPPVSTVLPEKAQTFLNTYFADDAVVSREKDNDGDYEVILASGIEIDFDSQGIWDNVDGKLENGQYKILPETFLTTELPAGIIAFIKTNYLNNEIVEVDKEFKNNVLVGYEVDLSSGVELDFDTNGNLTGSGGTSTVELPQTAKDFMNTHFSGLTYTTIKDENEYDVYAGAYKIEFDLQGNWTKVDSYVGQVKTALPQSFLALTLVSIINNYVTTNYPERYIIEIEKDYENGKLYYDIELDNQVDLVFDTDGQFVKRD